MLYVTTRNHRDAYTAHRALTQNRGPDGGLYLPFRLTRFAPEQIDALAEKPFNQCVAEIMNHFFNTRLDSWDVDFSAGRYPVRLKAMSHRIIMGELWYNPDWDFDRMVKNLSKHILSKYQITECAEWTYLAVRIAVLFGIFGQLIRGGIAGKDATVDISLVSGDFSAPMALWYARVMGLPIGNIVCCCNENNSLWELMHHGQLRTDCVATPTSIPDADVGVPVSLERLVHACGGYSEANRYLDICRRGGIYAPNEVMLARLRAGMDVSVVSSGRMESAIANVYRTNAYLMGPYTALAYTGLLDYRSRTGESRYSLILADKSPVCHVDSVADAMGVSTARIRELIDQM